MVLHGVKLDTVAAPALFDPGRQQIAETWVEKTMRFPFDIHGATETVQYPRETISSDQINRLNLQALSNGDRAINLPYRM